MGHIVDSENIPELQGLGLETRRVSFVVSAGESENRIFAYDDGVAGQGRFEVGYEDVDALRAVLDYAQWQNSIVGNSNNFYDGVAACFEIVEGQRILARARTLEQAKHWQQVAKDRGLDVSLVERSLLVAPSLREHASKMAQRQVVDRDLEVQQFRAKLLECFAGNKPFAYVERCNTGYWQFVGEARVVALDLERGVFRDDCQDDPIRIESLVLLSDEPGRNILLKKVFLDDVEDFEDHGIGDFDELHRRLDAVSV